MKPKKNRVFCPYCKFNKMLFPSEEKANNFIRFNAEEMKQEGKKVSVRSYFCKACGGWHVTSVPYARRIKRIRKLKECNRGGIKKEEQAIYDWKTHRKVVEEAVGKVWTAYLQYKYDICYQLIGPAYIEVEKAEEQGIEDDALEKCRQKLRICGKALHRGLPKGNPKLNEILKRLEFNCILLKTVISLTKEGYEAWLKLAEKMRSDFTEALHQGAYYKQLKKYSKIIDFWLLCYQNEALYIEYMVRRYGLHPGEKRFIREHKNLFQ